MQVRATNVQDKAWLPLEEHAMHTLVTSDFHILKTARGYNPPARQPTQLGPPTYIHSTRAAAVAFIERAAHSYDDHTRRRHRRVPSRSETGLPPPAGHAAAPRPQPPRFPSPLVNLSPPQTPAKRGTRVSQPMSAEWYPDPSDPSRNV